MKINGQHYRSIWLETELPLRAKILDQRWLPHQLVVEELSTLEDFENAIREMHVRGAPLIGATAAFGYAWAAQHAPMDATYDEFMDQAFQRLAATRPTAVDLFNALQRLQKAMEVVVDREEKARIALNEAKLLVEESAEQCRLIGMHGLPLIQEIAKKKAGKPVNILTHCNAGWLACVDFGTATSPMYQAFDAGIDIHVWVDETRPRNQGARLTAYELGQHGIPHTIITDNAGGHLMQHGLVDLVFVGSDRTTRSGDVANKIGTYLKALAAYDNQIPFYVALPVTSFDFSIRDGLKEIPIEQRGAEEVTHIQGLHEGAVKKVLLSPPESPAANYAFDVTPARLVTGLITERGICAANEKAISELYAMSTMSPSEKDD